MPYFQVDYSVLANGPVNVEESKLNALDINILNFDIKNSTLPEGNHLVVTENSQFDTSILSKISTALAPRGFVLLVENISICVPSSTLKSLSLQIVSNVENNGNKYFLLKKVK